MVIRKAAIVTFVFALLIGTTLAADPQVTYKDGVESLYNLYFDKAEADFKNLTNEFPDDPLYWNSLASTIWLKILYNQQKLNIESFSMKDTFGTSQSKDDVNAREEMRLTDTIAKAMDKADVILKKNPNDTHALYAKGASYGTLATYHATVKRAYFKAQGEAEMARDLHRKVLKIDPNFHDAEMSIGVYNYVVGIIPGWVKLTIGLFIGLHGEGKDVGIREIENAARLGNLGATDAKMMLLIVYNREGRHNDALKLVNDLHAKYPRNFLFDLSRAQILRKMGKGELANQTYDSILKKIASRSDGYERLRTSKVYYDQAKAHIEQGDFNAVYATYAKIVEPKSDATPDERADAHIWMGMILDSQKKRKEALEHYNAVAALNCDPEFKDKANQYKRRAYQP